MSRLSKTASAAIAALVVSGAAVVASLLGPSAAVGPGEGTSPSGSAGGGASATSRTLAAAPPDEASGVPPTGAGTRPAARRAVLFIGDGPALRPRGGARASFVCRAATVMERSCSVSARVPVQATAAKLRPDVVVLVMTPADDARSLTADLDALPPALRGVRTVIVAPVAVTRTRAAGLAAVRALAAARGADVVDPVDLHWVTASTRATYLAADGARPTAAGTTHLGEQLALALTALGA